MMQKSGMYRFFSASGRTTPRGAGTLNQAFGKICETGDDGVRTHDLRIANATLSQLSYVPVSSSQIIPPSRRLATSGETDASDHPRRRRIGTKASGRPARWSRPVRAGSIRAEPMRSTTNRSESIRVEPNRSHSITTAPPVPRVSEPSGRRPPRRDAPPPSSSP